MPHVADHIMDLAGVEEITRVGDLPGEIAPPGSQLGWERQGTGEPAVLLTLPADHYALMSDDDTGVIVGHREDLIAWLGSAREALVRERVHENRQWAR